MKGLFLSAALGVVCISAFAQGVVNFANAGVGFTAPVYNTDGVTPLTGSAWSADLYWAPGTVTDSTLLTALNEPTAFVTVPSQAGYFFGGLRTVPLVPFGNGVITAQVRVWDTASGSSWAVAAATPGARVGESILFQQQLYVPGVLDGSELYALKGHSWSVSVVGVPEPSTFALATLGLGGALLLRRRKLALTTTLAVVCVSSFAQGTLNFANAGVGATAQVTDTDGATGLLGSAWSADLYWAPGTVTDSTLLTALNQPTTFSTVPAQPGYFFGGVRTIPLVPLGTGVMTAQVRVWDTVSGSSWAVAALTPGARVGESILFQVTLANPNSCSPGVPTSMAGLNGHPWSVSIVGVPEPSTLALAALGLAAVLMRCRKMVLMIVLVGCTPAFAQGTVNFANAGVGFMAKVTDTDGITGLSGSAWSADLYWAPGTVTDSTLLTALNQPTTFATAPDPAGFFFGGVRTIPLVPFGNGVITAQVRVWDTASGNSWAVASMTPGARVGESILFQVTTSRIISPNPGLLPAALTGLNGHPWSVSVVGVPEPSTLALAGLGFAAVLVLRRRRVVLTLLFAATCCSGFGQGTLNFANAGVGFSAKITDTAGNGLAGSVWDVDLYWAAGTVANSTLLAALGAPATFSTVPSQAGYFFGGTRTVPLTPYGSGVITAQLRVWEAAYGSTWLQASTTPGAQIGTSVLFQVTLGNPNTTPPGIPATMIGLNGLPFQTEVPSLVPEPSALALAGLGFAAMLALRRRRPS